MTRTHSDGQDPVMQEDGVGKYSTVTMSGDQSPPAKVAK
eukprot:gene26832-biopygen17421